MNLEVLRDIPPWDWPADARKLFHDALTDNRTRPADRMAAAELAGVSTVLDDSLAQALLTVVANAAEPERLRARAAISLGPALEQADAEEIDDPGQAPITKSLFAKIQQDLRNVFQDTSSAKQVRRRVLEASVRAPEDWHHEAIRKAYSSGDRDWMLTAVFAMRFIPGFDGSILEALKIRDPEIHGEAVQAASAWEIEAAWPHVVALIQDEGTPKRLLLAAIDAVSSIRPAEAERILSDLADSDDEDIAEAVEEAILMAAPSADGEGGWVN